MYAVISYFFFSHSNFPSLLKVNRGRVKYFSVLILGFGLILALADNYLSSFISNGSNLACTIIWEYHCQLTVLLAKTFCTTIGLKTTVPYSVLYPRLQL